MACLEMYNNAPSPQQSPSISPRISFSNDFVESSHISSQHSERIPPPPSSSDFEFSVSNHSMLCADELFFKGRLLPFKDHTTVMSRTLRDELLNDDDYDDNDDVKTCNKLGSCKWKGFLGLKKTHIEPKKLVKTEGTFDGDSFFSFHVENTHLAKSPPDSNEDPVSIDMEMKK